MGLVLMLLLCFLLEFSTADDDGYDRDDCPVRRLDNGRARGRLNARYICKRGYQLVGPKFAHCVQGVWDVDMPVCTKPGCPRSNAQFINGIFSETYRGAVVRVICAPGYQTKGTPVVYCNGRRWNDTFPVCTADSAKSEKSCSFEDERLCGWSQENNQNLLWVRQNYESENITAPPKVDKTPNEYFMMVDIPRSRRRTYPAKLYSPVYSSNAAKRTCLSFWYQISGDPKGTLKVFVKLEGRTLENSIPLFWVTEAKDNHWLKGFFLIEPTFSQYQIVFDAEADGFSDSYQVSIDNVSVLADEECNDFMKHTEETSESATDPIDTIADFTCRNRCNESAVFVDSGDMTAADLDEVPKCDCHMGCLNNILNCCNDYHEFCVLDGDQKTRIDYNTSETNFTSTNLKTNESAPEVQTTTAPSPNSIRTLSPYSTTKNNQQPFKHTSYPLDNKNTVTPFKSSTPHTIVSKILKSSSRFSVTTKSTPSVLNSRPFRITTTTTTSTTSRTSSITKIISSTTSNPNATKSISSITKIPTPNITTTRKMSVPVKNKSTPSILMTTVRISPNIRTTVTERPSTLKPLLTLISSTRSRSTSETTTPTTSTARTSTGYNHSVSTTTKIVTTSKSTTALAPTTPRSTTTLSSTAVGKLLTTKAAYYTIILTAAKKATTERSNEIEINLADNHNRPHETVFTYYNPRNNKVPGTYQEATKTEEKELQAISIPLSTIIEATSGLVILILVGSSIAVFILRRRKRHRECLVEDSDSIVYEVSTSSGGSHSGYTSLVCIQPTHARLPVTTL